MQDFTRYSYEFKSADELLTALKECKDNNLEPLIILNGEYYSLSKDFFEEKGEN